jgi:hypothetical protein
MMPDFTAGNQATTMVDEAVSAIPGQILPEVHPPSAPTPSNPQGDHRVMSRPAPIDTEGVGPEVPAEVRPADSPDDRGVPSRYPGDQPVPPDTPGKGSPRGRESFATENDEAIAVFQRSSEAWTGRQFLISGPTQIVRRMKGRESATIFVPATDVNGNAITGVIFGPDDSEVQGQGNPLFLLPGMSASIESEAPVWAAPIPGNSTGYVCVLTTDNPSGGQLGGL